MGVPAFFRWLCMRYPKVVIDAYNPGSDNARLPDKNTLDLAGIDPELENPEIDNLYLDMNGIIHPCTTGLNGKKPTSEAEMFNNIFEYVDMLMAIIKPKQMIYFAVGKNFP